MIRNYSRLQIFIAFTSSLMVAVSAFTTPATSSKDSILKIRLGEKALLPNRAQRYYQGLNVQYHSDTRLYNKLLDFLSPVESKIPEELREEIYQAEAKTAAAKDRGTRIAIYTSLAIFGISLASFNGFLTDMRDKESAVAFATAATSMPNTGNNLYILQQNGFGWVLSNPVFKFLFTNKIGGVISLLFGGGSGIMAEAEFDSKRINAEKIYEELKRRREQKMKKQTGNSANKIQSKKKKRPGKEKKRLAAISEVLIDDATSTTTQLESENRSSAGIPVIPSYEADESSSNDESESGADDEKSIFGNLKELYEKADSMAASQALIMNKNLEEAGVLEKITDDTGLRVIGREEAKKLEYKKIVDEKKKS